MSGDELDVIDEPTHRPSTGKRPGLLCRLLGTCDGRLGEPCSDCGQTVTARTLQHRGRP